MKSFSLIFTFCFITIVSFAQHVPQGMKYQAVARNNSGIIIANQAISLKIDLVTQQDAKSTIYYSEIHNVTTNQLGLFTLTIGDGKIEKGTFSSIPWSTADIWMEVALKEKSDFVVISTSKLLAVPYAFHSETANKLVGDNLSATKPVSQLSNILDDDSKSVCSCDEGLISLKLLYLGNNNVDIKIFADKDLRQLIFSYIQVKNGDILNVMATSNRRKLPNEIYLQIQNTTIPVLEMPSACNNTTVGETYGNFSVISRTDTKNSTCSVCDIKQNWKIGGNVIFDLCNTIGAKSKSDLVFITDNTERMRITTDGNTNVTNTLNVGKNLNVTGPTYLKNTLAVDGIQTITNNTV